jgi:tRNA1Val (adenine37-N6)-methyltransferase
MSEFERIDELYCKGYRIIQDRRAFCFGIDAVLLSDFARIRRGDRVADLCCGNGVISLLLAAKTQAEEIIGLEIQPLSCELARRSAALNGEEGRIRILQGDVKMPPQELKPASFDVITVNPPYKEARGNLQSEKEEQAIARHEILCTMRDVVERGAALLRFGGRFYMIHRPDRLVDIFEAMRSFRLEPKRLRMVHPQLRKEPTMVLIEGRKGGARQLTIDPPLVVYDDKGEYTKEIHAIYGRED